jgi:hypothetical protein
MESRIRAFDNIYRERLLVRLSGVGPDQDPDLYREVLGTLFRPILLRQDNRHHLLSNERFAERYGRGEEYHERFAEWYAGQGQEYNPEEDWGPLDYDDDAGEVYDMLLLE